jgi:LysM repeat protein
LIETNPELFEEKNYEIKGRNKMESSENPLLNRGLPKNYDSSNNNYKVHKVAQGETVFSIAKKYGVSTDNLKKLNNLSSTDILKTGQIIRIE